MKTKLINFIKTLIEKRGAIPFDEFMEIALYHPKWGYYSSEREVIGKRGDYYTSSDVHPLFGWTIGRFLISLWEKEGRPEKFNLVEVGPGKGFLSLDILEYVEKIAHEFFENLTLFLVEKSPFMRRKLREILSPFRGKVKVYEDFTNFNKMDGIVYSNELFDALPVKRFFIKDGKWYEIMVVYEKGRFNNKPELVVDSSLLKILSRYEKYVTNGGHVELSLHTFTIIEEISELLERGYFIILDYGERREGLLSRFPKGSIAGFYKHTVTENPYEKIGEQDLTYHVDFTLLEEILEYSGFEIMDYMDQGKFLMESGIIDILQSIEKKSNTKEAIKAMLAMKSLVFDFSSNYRVLISRKKAFFKI